MNNRKRLMMLVGAACVLGALVALDAASSTDTTSTRRDAGAEAAYLDEANAAAAGRSVLSGADEWKLLERRLAERWRDVRGRMIETGTTDQASLWIQDRVKSLAKQVSVDLDASTKLEPTRPLADGPLHVVGRSFTFEVDQLADLLVLLERIESQQDVLMNIRRLTINGPGPAGGAGLSVDLDVQAMCLVREGARGRRG